MPEKYRRPHNHERRQTVEDMKLAWATERQARPPCAGSTQYSAKGRAWFWPKIAAALVQNITGWSLPATVATPWWTWTCALNPVTLKHPFVWRCAMSDARAAMDMAGHGFAKTAERLAPSFRPSRVYSLANSRFF
jgi:hypothetical protein